SSGNIQQNNFYKNRPRERPSMAFQRTTLRRDRCYKLSAPAAVSAPCRVARYGRCADLRDVHGRERTLRPAVQSAVPPQAGRAARSVRYAGGAWIRGRGGRETEAGDDSAHLRPKTLECRP